MKKFRKMGLTLGIIILIMGLFSISKIRDAYRNMADRSIYNIISGIKKRYPEMTNSELLELANQDGKLDLSSYGIYSGKGLLNFEATDKKVIFVMAVFITLTCSTLLIYLLVTKKYWKNTINSLIEDMEKINMGLYDIKFINEEDDLARLQNEMYKVTVRLREEAENAKKSKLILKKSLEDISHQIKTPIASINLILENINDPDIKESDKEELLNYIQIETDAITSLVLMLLNVAIFESGTLELNREKIDLKHIVDMASSILEPISKSEGIIIENRVQNISYFGDPKWEKELYINLLKNSLEHSKGEYVEVYAQETATYIEVFVENFSDPISEENRVKVFDRFYKLSDKEGNYGIGLNLCKMIADSNNAKIRMESSERKVRLVVKYYKADTI